MRDRGVAPGARVRRSAGAAAVALLLGSLGTAAPSAAQELHVLTVVGLGGDPAYTESFLDAGLRIRAAALERFGIPEDRVTLLAEDPTLDPLVDGRSDREGVEAAVNSMGAAADPSARVLVVLIGHGSYRNGQARFNLPGRDLDAEEWDALLEALGDRTVAVVNAASASGPFIEALSGPDRAVITATRTGGERNETRFPGFFAEALAEEGADLDRDGRLSLLEAFTWTRAEVGRWYEEQGLLLTEHAVLDDNGDGEGSEEPGPDGPDGVLAGLFRLSAPATVAGAARGEGEVPTAVGAPGTGAAAGGAPVDSVAARLRSELSTLEEQVARLRQRRETLDPEEYEARLEELLVEIALKNREIRGRSGGGS